MRKSIFALAVIASLSACTRIETGEVGLRVDMSKQVSGAELQPGSWNQTIIGDVLTFPTKDISISIENKNPLTADNSTLADFDMTIVYGINQAMVSDMWTTKSKSFHSNSASGDVLLMYNYMATLVNNAAYRAVREYKALEVADKRQLIEQKIKQYVDETLTADKLSNSVSLSLVQIRNILPAKDIIESANAVVRSSNELKVKETEVQIAEAESRRMAELAKNAGQSIAYMNAQANLMLAQGVKEGKVHSVVVPYNFSGIVNVGK